MGENGIPPIRATTVACARCHDHKFDLIPTNDYYALAGIFRSTKTLAGVARGSWDKNNTRDFMALAALSNDQVAGSENQELPGFITLKPLSRIGGAQNDGSSFLPAPLQGSRIGGEGESLAKASVPHIANREMSPSLQRKQLDQLQSLNRTRLEHDAVNNDLEGVIQSYELA